MDNGIPEERFWFMTLAELEREIESKKRMYHQQAKEKASYDYILADLIGRSISRIHSSSNKMPSIAEVYPSLFVAEEIEEQQRAWEMEQSTIRFKQFAEAFNKRKKGEANK